MKFAERLEAMVKNNEAITIKDGNSYLTAVMHGMYAGIWHWNATRKRVSYRGTSGLDCTVLAKKGFDPIKINIPVGLVDGNSKQFVNDKERKKYSWAVYKSKLMGFKETWAFLDDMFKRVELSTALIEEHTANMNVWVDKKSIVMDYLKTGFKLVFWINPELALAQFNNEKSNAIFFQIGKATSLIDKIGVRKRWVFLKNVFKIGWNAAWKKAFPNTSARLINDILRSNNYKSASLCSMKELAKESADINLQTFAAWQDFKERFSAGVVLAGNIVSPGHSKEFFLKISSKKIIQTITTYDDQVHRITLGGASLLTNYMRELAHLQSMANRINQEIPLPVRNWRLDDKLTPEAYLNRHETITRTYRQMNDAWQQEQWTKQNQQKMLTSEEIEKKHKDNWEKINLSNDIEDLTVIPLIEKKQFDDEGAKMHHCIATHFRHTDSVYASIKYKDEEASVQFHVESRKIHQLYSYCNANVSDDMRKAVMMAFDID